MDRYNALLDVEDADERLRAAPALASFLREFAELANGKALAR